MTIEFLDVYENCKGFQIHNGSLVVFITIYYSSVGIIRVHHVLLLDV